MTRPSDRAIAQALYELSDAAFGREKDEWIFPVLRMITDRAAELDATAAPGVVGEDTARLDWLIANRAMLTECNGLWWSAHGITCYHSGTARGAIDAAMTAALAGD